MEGWGKDDDDDTTTRQQQQQQQQQQRTTMSTTSVYILLPFLLTTGPQRVHVRQRGSEVAGAIPDEFVRKEGGGESAVTHIIIPVLLK